MKQGGAKQKQFSRRELLNNFGFAIGGASFLNPAGILIESLLNGMVNSALAAEMPTRRYLYIQQPGAPSRWMWDLFLTPYGSAGYQQNPMVATRFAAVDGRYTNLKYETVSRKGIDVPWLWQDVVPAPGGGTRPMDGLLENLLSIRGMHTGNAGHVGSQALHFKPIGAKKSVTALSADDSNDPISAVNVSAVQYDFQSTKNKASVSIAGGGNLLDTLLRPFQSGASASYKDRKGKVKAAISKAMGSLEAQARQQHPGAAAVIESRKAATQLLESGFGDLDAIWTTLVGKYSNLVSRAIRGTIPGISDLPIGPTGTRSQAFQLGGGIISNPDLRTMIATGTTIPMMAEHFAIAEYILLNRLSSSVAISPRPMTGLNSAGGGDTQVFDEHSTGGAIALFLNSCYYKAMSACLLELVARLKSANQFNETLIDVGGEFNRRARTNASGSDHLFEGASVALYSGIIHGPHVVGNIRTGPAGGDGYGAPVKDVGLLAPSHVAATIAAILGVASPVTAVNALVTTQDGVIKPIVEKATTA